MTQAREAHRLKTEERKRADSFFSRTLDNPANFIPTGLGEIRQDGTGILNIKGPLFTESSFISWATDGTSYEELTGALNELIRSPRVTKIALMIDSPGGEAAGVDELAQLVARAASLVPVTAYVAGMAASAAYWIASQASEIVVGSIGEVGSIGVVQTWVDFSKYYERMGISVRDIVSTQSPMKRPDPGTPEGEAEIKKTLDSMAEVFVGRVSSGRGVTSETVLADFGRGWVRLGQDAVDKGMADRVGSFAEDDRAMEKKKMSLDSLSVAQLRERFPEAVAEIESSLTKSLTVEFEKAAAVADAKIAADRKAELEAATTAAVAGERERIAKLAAFHTSDDEGRALVVAAMFTEPRSPEQVAVDLMSRKTGTSADQLAADATGVPSSIDSAGDDPALASRESLKDAMRRVSGAK